MISNEEIKLKKGKDYIGVGAGAVIMNDNDEILMLLRNKEPEAACWSIPGGAVEFFETLEDAIVREVKEEVGVTAEVVDFLGVTNHIIPEEGLHWVTTPFLVKIKEGVPTKFRTTKTFGFKVVFGKQLAGEYYNDNKKSVRRFNEMENKE